MGARLGLYWQNWEAIDADDWVTSILKGGYFLPFDGDPPLLTTDPLELSYSVSHKLFQELRTQLQKLLDKDAVEEVQNDSPGFYSRLFLTTKKTGGWRPVIDLSALNQHITPPKFKMESVRSIMKALQPDMWCTSLDLQDAFFHIPVAPRHRRYLRFMVEGKKYQFRCLPFGLGTSPYVFTRVVKAVGSYARSRGLLLIQYLDDWSISGHNSVSCKRWTDWLLQLAIALGLLPNIPKSDLDPSQLFPFIGIQFDLTQGTARPVDHRIQNFIQLAHGFLQCQVQPARMWQQLLGHLTSLEQLVFRGRLHMRPLQFRLQTCWSQHRDDQSKLVNINQEAKQALQWWMNTAHLKAGVPMHESPPETTLFTDASTEGWGAHMEQLQAEGLWTPAQRPLHINNLELLAVLLALQEFEKTVHGKRVLVMTDNTTVVGHIRNQGGTHSRELFKLTTELFQWADEHQVLLVARHIPGHLNVIADRLSRRHQIIHTEWSLAPAVAAALWLVWGQPHVDLFATSENAKLPVFVSPLPEDTAWKVDALSFSWKNLWAYLYPPVPLLPEVLHQISQTTCEVVLIAPAWPTQTWYSLLLDLSVDHPRQLPLIRTLLKQPGSNVFHNNASILKLHAWRLSGPLCKARATQQEWLSASLSHTDPALKPSTIASGGSTVIGVRNMGTIRSLPLHLQ